MGFEVIWGKMVIYDEEKKRFGLNLFEAPVSRDNIKSQQSQTELKKKRFGLNAESLATSGLNLGILRVISGSKSVRLFTKARRSMNKSRGCRALKWVVKCLYHATI